MTTATASVSAAAPAPARVEVLRRRVRLVVGATIAYNVVEAAVAITAGTVASSAALVGFGLDSTVEVVSAAAIAWQFAAADHRSREPVALRVVAFSFFALAAYVTFDALRSLTGATVADHSTVGITLAAVSLAVMPFLSWAERRAGRELGSASVVADSRQTLLCSYLSGVLLVGLVLTSALGWAWVDPAAALVIAAVAVREGIAALRGDTCCVPPSALLSAADEAADAGCGCGPACGCEGCAGDQARTAAPVELAPTATTDGREAPPWA